MNRRVFCASIAVFGLQTGAFAHSPWGQYQVYRKKHLLILSTRDDEPSYKFSKELVSCLGDRLPSAKARPARAISLDRSFELLRTDQFQFALLSKANIETMRSATGRFSGKPPVDLKTILAFGDLEFAVRADFPAELVAMVTHGLLECKDSFSIKPGTDESVLRDPNLHEGAARAIRDFAV